MMPFFPLRKIRRNGTYLLFGAVLVVMGVAGYLEYVATNLWHHVGKFKHLGGQRVTSRVVFLPSSLACISFSPDVGFRLRAHMNT